jgi:hypothetical protein
MRRPLVVILLALAAAALLLPVQPASATQGTLAGSTLSSWQTNGTVVAIAYAGGVVYLAGDFTSVRPSGAAAGTGEVARTYLAAFDANTGELIAGFNHTLDARPNVLAVSRDGTVLYAGGTFLKVDGKTRTHLAAFSTDASTGFSLLGSWTPTANAAVNALAVTSTTVYVGGSFTSARSTPRTRLAAFATSNGALLPWAPTADKTVTGLAVSPDGTIVVVGGYFSNLSGVARRATGALAADGAGAVLPWLSTVVPPVTTRCNSNVEDLKLDSAGNAYFGAVGTGGGCFDGTFSAKVSSDPTQNGATRWVDTCLGGTQAVEIVGGFMYKGSHAHDCSSEGLFPQVATGASRHLMAWDKDAGAISSWWPNTNANGQEGPRAMATDGQQLFLGGDFTTVNTKPQQGFARFGPGATSTAKPRKPAKPTASSTTAGKVTVSWKAVLDDDDTDLTYRVYRDGGATPVFTTTAHSVFWSIPTLSFSDSQPSGTSHTYRVDAVDNNGLVSFKSDPSDPVTVL